MSYGFDLKFLEMFIKLLVFLILIFVFVMAEEGVVFFCVMFGQVEEGDLDVAGFMYFCFNNLNMEVFEDCLVIFDGVEDVCVFVFGMVVILIMLMVLVYLGFVIF